MTTRIGINGFGRLAVRAPKRHPDLELAHINELNGAATTSAHLLEFDTVHGRFAHRFVELAQRVADLAT